MAAFSRSFLAGANPLPSWRLAMTAAGVLHKVAGDPEVQLAGTAVWPSGSMPQHWGGAYMQHAGYGAAVLCEDIGPFGTFVYWGTGEDTFNTHATSIPLSTDVLAWQMFQQPYYATSEAEAIAQDGDWYLNLSLEASLTAAKPSSAMNNPQGVYELASWDKTFPVTLKDKGWIQYRKAKQTLGKNQPIRMRYNTPCFVPASMTGTGAGAIIAFDDNFAGPLRGNSGLPANFSTFFNGGATYNPADYAADVMPNGDLGLRFRAMNTQTKAWTTLPPLHRVVNSGSDITRGHAFVDFPTKRVYYTMAFQYSMYLDLSAGLAGATVSTPVAMTLNPPAGNFGQVEVNSAHGPCENHPQGRKLVFLKLGPYGANPSDTSKLYLYDHDGPAAYILDFAAIGFDFLPSPGQVLDWGFGYAPRAGSYGTLYVTYRKRFTTEYYCTAIPLPADPTNVANYVGSYAPVRTLLTAGPSTTLEVGAYTNPFGRMRAFVERLGVIFWPHNNQVMAFRPPA